LTEAARLTAEVVRLYGLQKYDEALPLARRAVELRERALGGEHMLVANALNNLGAIFMQKDQDDEATRTLERALAIIEKLGAGEATLAADINNRLGLLRLEAKDYKRAAGFFERTLAINQKAHGENAPPLVPALLNLTDTNFLLGDREKAHATLRHAAEILAVQFPKKDLSTAKKLQSYICLLKMEGEDDLLGKVEYAVGRLEDPEGKGVLFKPPTKEELKRVGGGVLNGRAIKKPAPEYPTAAKSGRVSGTVVVRILVDETGKVIKSEAICGHSLLRKAAADAAAAALFTQTLLEGKPVKVSGIITYNFVLR
jgi:TonB family protein